MKTTIKQITALTFVALLLIAGNVRAMEIKGLNLKAKETNLQLENWMINEAIWNANTSVLADFAEVNESSLQLENWMTDNETWNSNFIVVEATEQRLELEGWMTDNKTWKGNISNESSLALEAWMTNSEIWE